MISFYLKKIHFLKCVIAFVGLLLVGCSSLPSNESDTTSSNDPLESINRPFWTFTWEYADKHVFKPASQAYTENVNEDVRLGLFNMAMNLNEPSSVINHLLQGKFSDAAKTAGRFLLNSTIGLFGIFDPASDFGWARSQEEFGEVLGTYGVSDGPYLVVPALGPSSVREEVGDYVDKLYWPLAIIDFWPNLLRVGVIGLEQRAALADQEQLINDSLDSYEFVKNAYFQNMKFKVYDGNPPIELDDSEEDLEAFMDEFEDIED